ncbi:MAG: response regulator transcription factor [Bryobacteraceae bacterium]
MPDAIRVVIIEDQRRTREGLAALIGGSPGMEVVGHYGSGEESLRDLPNAQPDVVLCDLGLPGMSGIQVVTRLRDLIPTTPVLVLTVLGDDQFVFDALYAGACGYLMKDVEPAKLLLSIREVAAGGAPMSPEIARRVVAMFQKLAGPKPEESGLSARELQVLQLLAEGDSYKACAATLNVSIDTIRFHVRHIYERLHVNSRSAAVSKAFRNGLIR